MLKTINIDQLKVGMYVERVDKGWLELPFFRKSISTAAQIERLRRYQVGELQINTKRGDDITVISAEPVIPVLETSSESVAVATAEPIVEIPVAVTEPKGPTALDSSIKPREFHEELETATVAYTQAIDAMRDILDEARAGRALHEEPTRLVVSELVNSCMRNDDALVSLSKLLQHDEYTFSHSVNVTVFALTLAKSVGMPREEMQPFGESVLLHDVGKMLVPQEILNKPGKLTPEEFEIMKLHVDRGVELLLKSFPDREELALVALEHHERFDGSGYPNGKRSQQISQWGQVTAVADVYDALTSERCYKKAMPTVKAISLIYRLRGGDFNPHCVDKFVECVGIYPMGTLVRLSSREIGVVTSMCHEDLLRPKVTVLYRGNSKLQRPALVDLREQDQNGDHLRTVEEILNPEDYGVNPADHVLEA